MIGKPHERGTIELQPYVSPFYSEIELDSDICKYIYAQSRYRHSKHPKGAKAQRKVSCSETGIRCLLFFLPSWTEKCNVEYERCKKYDLSLVRGLGYSYQSKVQRLPSQIVGGGEIVVETTIFIIRVQAHQASPRCLTPDHQKRLKPQLLKGVPILSPFGFIFPITNGTSK